MTAALSGDEQGLGVPIVGSSVALAAAELGNSIARNWIGLESLGRWLL
jgi:hypothetical protein